MGTGLTSTSTSWRSGWTPQRSFTRLTSGTSLWLRFPPAPLIQPPDIPVQLIPTYWGQMALSDLLELSPAIYTFNEQEC